MRATYVLLLMVAMNLKGIATFATDFLKVALRAEKKVDHLSFFAQDNM